MSSRVSTASDQEFFHRQIEEFNADQQRQWELQQRKARRRRRNPKSDAARMAFLDALDDWRERSGVRWFGPVRWIPTRSNHS